MHEATLAANILEIALRVAREHHAGGIASVRVRIGALQAVVPEALEMAFDAGKADTPAARATLRMDLVAACVRCGSCGCEYAPDDVFWMCPQCEAIGGCALAGDEFEVVGVELLETAAPGPA